MKKLNKPEKPVKSYLNSKTFARCMIFLVVAVLLTAPCFALATEDGQTLVHNMFSNVFTIITSIAKAAGVFMLLWGLIQVGISISSHDAQQRMAGFLLLGGGVIIFFSPEILQSLGATF